MHRLPLLAAIALLAASCGGARTAPHAQGPVNALGAPKGYHVQHIWHADLSGGRVPDIVVSSIGPPMKTFLGRQRPTDLRVLVPDTKTHRWRASFDAQKTAPATLCAPAPTNIVPCAVDSGETVYPLLDPQGSSYLEKVRFAHLLSRRRDDLVFSAATWPAADGGSTTVLAVVDFAYREASLKYTWIGARSLNWTASHGRIRGEAEYYEGIDTPTGDIRPYRFTVAPRGELGDFVETSDDRAWLGVTIRWSPRELKVVGIEPESPAEGALRVGDVLLNVLNPPSRRWPTTVNGQIRSFHAGQVARLLLERSGHKLVVRVRLGSLKDSIPDVISFSSRLGDL